MNNSIKYMHLSALIPTNLIHPDINNDDIWDGETKECNLSLDNSLIFISLDRVKSLSINNIKFAIILRPHSPRAPMPILTGIQRWKMCPECSVDQSTLTWTLGAEYWNICSCCRVLYEGLTEILGDFYLNWPD